MSTVSTYCNRRNDSIKFQVNNQMSKVESVSIIKKMLKDSNDSIEIQIIDKNIR